MAIIAAGDIPNSLPSLASALLGVARVCVLLYTIDIDIAMHPFYLWFGLVRFPATVVSASYLSIQAFAF